MAYIIYRFFIHQNFSFTIQVLQKHTALASYFGYILPRNKEGTVNGVQCVIFITNIPYEYILSYVRYDKKFIETIQ